VKVFFFLLVGLLLAAPARADKLIWIPTADVEEVRGEFMAGSDREGEVVTAQFGVGQYFELLGRRFQQPGSQHTEVGGQVQFLPEGLVTPGLAVGIWDVSDETARGRRAFGVLSKQIPGVNLMPVIRKLRLHLGVGTGDLSGVFMGADLDMPLGLSLVMETHRGDFNAGLWWSPLRIVRLKAESWNGDLFFGAQVNAPL
jgi:hypothetical protein